MKLFDRSVDLAKYNENSPLYPICRDWMINQPRNRRLQQKKLPTPQKQRKSNEILLERIKNGELVDVTEMPASLDIEITRVPSLLPFQNNESLDTKQFDKDMKKAPLDRDTIMAEHRNRWTQVRKKWIAQAKICEEKFAPSIAVLNAIYNQ